MTKDISKILFFDIEVVKNSENLNPNSKEFDLYRWKTRNRENDDIMEENDVIKHYNKFAGLKAIYHKVCCISVGAIKDGKLYLKSYTGSEQEIIENFYKKTQEYDYLCGFNNMSYDLPLIRICALRYPDVLSHLPDRFEDSGIRDLKLKKSWNLDRILDLMDFFRGGHYSNIGLSEVAYHLGIESPKSDDMNGSMVSEVYYKKDGIAKIEAYCKRDVFTSIQLFCRLTGRELFTDFIDIDKLNETKDFDKPLPLLERILSTNTITKESLEQLKTIAEGLLPDEKVKALELLNITIGSGKKSKLQKEVVALFI